MRSIYRIKRLAISSGCTMRLPLARPISTTIPRTKEQSVTPGLDLSALGQLEPSAPEASSSTRWSDAGASTSTLPSEASSSQSQFFTPFRPSTTLPIPPASQSDLQSLHRLWPLLYRDLASRNEGYYHHVWKEYNGLAISTRRALHPKILQMVLRAIVPNRAHARDWKRKTKDPVRGLGAYAEKMERRLQVIIADMSRSTWVNLDDRGTKSLPLPDYADFTYAMSVLANLGATEACEGMYREIKEKGWKSTTSKESFLVYRLEALKTWMTGRVRYANWTKQRPASASSVPSAYVGSMRYRPERSTRTRNPSTYTITTLWSILRDLETETNTSATKSDKLYPELVVTLRQILRFLPETETGTISTLQKILKQALEKGFGIDFRFLRQNPGSTQVVSPKVLESVVYLMGSQGDVWRMLAMYEALADPQVVQASSTLLDESTGDVEDMGQTLSEALRAEAASRESFDWLGRARPADPSSAQVEEVEIAGIASTPTQDTDAQAAARTRLFDDYLDATPSLRLSESSSEISTHPQPAPKTTTAIISTMMEAIKRAGNVDLALHLLRTSLRDTAASRHDWLSSVLSRPPTIKSDEPSDTAAEASAPSSSVLTPDSVGTVGIEIPPRRLLVSAQWFEAVHLLARKGAHNIWAAVEVRKLMDLEIQALRDEYQLLTGTGMDSDTDTDFDLSTLPASAPIHSTTDIPVFDPARHLKQLRKTHDELSRMLAASVYQQEKRREVAKAKNVRRAEREIEAARLEQEKVEAKKASRRQRDEMHEAPLALA